MSTLARSAGVNTSAQTMEIRHVTDVEVLNGVYNMYCAVFSLPLSFFFFFFFFLSFSFISFFSSFFLKMRFSFDYENTRSCVSVKRATVAELLPYCSVILAHGWSCSLFITFFTY